MNVDQLKAHIEELEKSKGDDIPLTKVKASKNKTPEPVPVETASVQPVEIAPVSEETKKTQN